MTVHVFLGPSLPLARARQLIDAQFLPPVSMGDVYVLVRTRARAGDVIAIIDGLFEQIGAVWHKEILYALAAGVQVYGASSMGALRAAELHAFGMRGVGRIFKDYRDGVLTDDDDVAVAHALAEDGYRSLSVAMASLRYALAAMQDTGALSEQQRTALETFAKSQPYGQRSWGALMEHARAARMPGKVLEALRAEASRPDAKALDAEELLRELAVARAPRPEAEPVRFCFNRTAFWAMLEHEMHARVVASAANADTTDNDDQPLVDAIRAHSPHRRQVEEEAIILEMAVRRSMDWQPDQDNRRAAIASIAHRHRLSGDQLGEWLAMQRMDATAWKALVDLEARRERLFTEFRPSLVPYLAAAARRAGLAGVIRAEVDAAGSDAADSEVAEHHRIRTSLIEDDVDIETLQRWYVARCGPMLPDPERHALALGFPTLRDFVTVIAAAYRACEPNRAHARRLHADA